MLASSIFVLSTLTAGGCSALLFRAYGRTRTRLLLWSAICFAGLATNNALVFVDLILIPEVSLVWLRASVTILSLLVLIGGLVWETPQGGRR
ncbi:MAG TPA: DUF5985 family protein [Polyangiaceae bacterium]|nr:DUF5985 family protein [Polyangiaceae bacterium]